MKFMDRQLGGSYGAKQVVLYDDLWVYKTVRPYNEVAAYQIFEAIRPLKKGHWYVPKTIFSDDKLASLQSFVSDACEFAKLRMRVPNVDEITAAEITAFDYLITNGDRHEYNYLIDLVGQVVLIDHGNAFNGSYSSSYLRYLFQDSTVIDWSSVRGAIEKIDCCDLPKSVFTRLDKLSKTPVKLCLN